ncbi:MAG: SDR family oxidoreductase [Acidobacteria bacterium]|nr:SDR family oxidoreductase [Acidobacteriota bacterium]
MDKTVLITGASSGIGLHTAKLFQTKNWKVAATMRQPENAEELQRIVDVECFRLDVTDVDSIQTAIAETIEKFGRIDAVVNNAGYGLLGPFEASSDEQVRRQFETNVFGTMNVCREIIPYFRERKGGYIVNVASMAGRTVFPFSSVYNATKWAIEGFTESLQYELDPFNIRLKLIEPGPINTDFYGRSQEVARKGGLSSYDHYVSRFISFMNKAGGDAPDGSIVAQAIYDAVTDGSRKLRYPVNTKGLLFLRGILPSSAYRLVTKTIFLR